MYAHDIVHTLEEIEKRSANMRQRMAGDSVATEDLKRDAWAVGSLARQIEELIKDIEGDSSLGEAC